MYVNVIHVVIALASIGATFGKVLFFEPRSSGTAGTILCPDGTTCSGSDTCCIVHPGVYGCCPLPVVSTLGIDTVENFFNS